MRREIFQLATRTNISEKDVPIAYFLANTSREIEREKKRKCEHCRIFPPFLSPSRASPYLNYLAHVKRRDKKYKKNEFANVNYRRVDLSIELPVRFEFASALRIDFI